MPVGQAVTQLRQSQQNQPPVSRIAHPKKIDRLPGHMLRLRIVRTSLLIRAAATIATISVLLYSCGKKPTETNSQAAVSGSAPVDYSSRLAIYTGSAWFLRKPTRRSGQFFSWKDWK